jgi:hypothetical protein
MTVFGGGAPPSTARCAAQNLEAIQRKAACCGPL